MSVVVPIYRLLTCGEYQFAPIPEFTPTFGSHSQQQQQQQQQGQQQAQALFHPSPQHAHTFMGMQTSPRSSLGLGLGYRRASSAQPMLMRSWTMPMGAFDYPSMNIPMERDPSPLPDVDPELFGDFSFTSTKSSSGENGAQVQSHDEPPSACGEEVDPASTTTNPAPSANDGIPIPPTSLALALAHIDTSVAPPEFSMHSASASATSTSASTSSSGSPPTALVDLSHVNNAGGFDSYAASASAGATTSSGRLDSLDMSAYMHLDGLYAPDAMSGGDVSMGMGMYAPDAHRQVYAHDHQYAMGMGMGVGVGVGVYGYDLDPVVSSAQGHADAGYLHQQKMAPVGAVQYGESFYAASA